jgi:succinate-semialdehyde dehydrogenase / glutarate-semialdehyde dehydrogenase
MAIATIKLATGELLRSSDALTDQQIEEKIALVVQAFLRLRAPTERSPMMLKVADLLEAEKTNWQD